MWVQLFALLPACALRPGGAIGFEAARVMRAPRAAATMLDPSIVADAATSAADSVSAVGSLSNGVLPAEQGHGLANLGADLLNTAMVATLGLMGAYVTQVRDARAHSCRDAPCSLCPVGLPDPLLRLCHRQTVTP